MKCSSKRIDFIKAASAFEAELEYLQGAGASCKAIAVIEGFHSPEQDSRAQPIEETSMEMKDRLALAAWLRSGASLTDVNSLNRYGAVENERFTEQARRAFYLIWSWSAWRTEGEAGDKQYRYLKARGVEALERRHQRAREWAERLK